MKIRSNAPLAARRGDPRGQVLVLFALVLVVLLLVSALAVDYGGWLVSRRNYQNVTDAAALAGAHHLTRTGPVPSTCTFATKNQCARQAAWESVRTALNFTALNPSAQATAASNLAYQEGGYSVWVASPPSDANVACNAGNPLCIHSGTVYPGNVSGPGTVFVRVEHDAAVFLSRIAGTSRTVAAWATAGRFPANFAVIGMCSPTSVTTNCLAGDANIKIDGSNSNLIVSTGDLGTNRWTKTGGSSSSIALGADSNAFMQLYDNCWTATNNQCQLFGYDGTNIDSSTIRSAVPLGAPIPDPAYPAPPITSTTTPNQCLGSTPVQLASVQVLERNEPGVVANLPIALAAARQPAGGETIVNAAPVAVSGVVKAQTGLAPLSGIVVTSSPGNGNSTTNASGAYSMSLKDTDTYTLTATDPTGVYHTTTATVVVGTSPVTVPDILMPKNPIVSGTVTSSTTGLPLNNVQITIQAFGTNYTTTTNASGNYTKTIDIAGTTVAYNITGTLTGYTSGGTNVPAPTAYDTNYPNKDFQLTVIPASVTGIVTDKVTGLPIPGVTVSLSTGQTAVTDASGTYNVPAATIGSVTFNLTGTAMDGYLPGNASSSHPTPYTTTVAAGTNSGAAFNFAVWPKGCKDANAARGDWSCAYPTGNNCGTVTNADAANVSCSKFDQSNAIRPGTYHDITIDGCAWLDPRGGATGLAPGQSAGIYHITGTVSISSDSYLFGDGVTFVMNQGSNFDVSNGGGFVLNFGSVASGSPLTCNLSTIKKYNDGTTPCFRTMSAIDSQDYAYSAWTTAGTSPWQSNSGSGCAQASPLAYNTTNAATRCFTPGTHLGITFYLNGSGLGNNSRFKLATANMGYLFNGVLYGPNDDVQLGGGKDGQTAAGQIVGWTIEYHGGTRILQNWYGDPIDGQPFLIEPVLGE
jgi:Flp pilus assembly protein TadG